MLSISGQEQLQQLRVGDRLNYHSVPFQVKNYSTYLDPKGYETTEWLLRSPTGQEYYLLQEVDPQNPVGLVHWYLAEEIYNPKIFQANLFTNITVSLWHDIQGHVTPYPELHALSRTYYFESQTEGIYQDQQGEIFRITWDYWDKAHQWNLGIEAWYNGKLYVYSTKVVQPEEFSQIQLGMGIISQVSSFPIVEFICACSLAIVGLFLLILG